MMTLSFEIDEVTAETIRQKVNQAGKTPGAWLTDVVHQQTTPVDNKEQINKPRPNAWIKGFLESARNSTSHSGGWKWNREELYNR